MKPSEAVAQLVVDAAIAGIAGTVRGKFPVAPVILNAQQCGELGLPPGSNTMFYPLDKSGVFYDVDEARSTIWYTGADAAKALATVEHAVTRAYPAAKRSNDEDDPREADMRVRTYDVKLPQGRLAIVQLSYPAPNSRAPKFVAQVTGMVVKQ
ncbi:MAG: hypothetical protein HY054_05055 [Proteobacteria bacterium]|nr:hypothetical protein [Pseudomonadota bacterium]